MVHYTFYTQKSVTTLISDLVEALMKDNFSILWQFELHQKLEEKGITPKRKQTILEVCNPDEAASILGINPLVGYFLPCKVVVTEEEDQVSVGFVRPTELIWLTKDQRAVEKAQEIEVKLVNAINLAI
ncbi:DUF302 domain-containing protein [Tepidibacillus marianensis]|uniref:DUF302 domain-containing protein n=1 Tax=Tepidibacillus marianensis TaxID=3131995 RepID=UPI0030D1BF10